MSCTPPVLQQAESAYLNTGALAFLEDGKTTREEVLWRLGTPNAHFEGERILTYAFRRFSDGSWIRLGRVHPPYSGGIQPTYSHPTENLVLVFGSNGTLTRHSLVVAK